MRKLLLLTALFILSTTTFAQSVSEIKNSGKYLWGEGMGETYKEANQMALQAIVEQISLSIESSFDNVEEEIVTNGNVDSRTAVRSVMKTYSQVTLDSTQQIMLSQEPNAHVIRYVLASEKNKFFENRRIKVFDFVNMAQKAEAKSNIDVALQNYYWAYCLLTSLPNSNRIPSPEEGVHMKTWIPNKMDDIFSNIKAQKQSEKDGFITLRITYKGQPVSRLDYTYFDGRGQTNIHTAVDGIGTMEMFPGVSTDNLKIKCEYEYEGQTRLDKEVETVVAVMKGCTFRKASIPVTSTAVNAGESTENNSEVEAHAAPDTTNKSASIMLCTESEAQPYKDIMSRIITAIKNKNYESVGSYFTDEGKEMFKQLLAYGNARIVEEPQLNYLKNGDIVFCRSIPMSFSFKNNNRKFVENVNFTFDANRQINCVAFGLEKSASDDILNHEDYSEQARIVLTEFLENYKTAFALKRLDYISSIFDDNALIITGTVVKKTNFQNKEEQTRYLDNNIIKYNRYTKNEYIDHLARCFQSKEFINIRFANNDIVKAGGGYGEVYGIQIKQDYYSNNYGDSGYLFLMVDLNNPDEPIIKVRTWQPDRDPNFGLYGLGDF
jgi:hypothetical protein